MCLCVRSISQPPAGLGAGCYLAGQLGFGGAVWVSGRSERGWSILGAELLLENRDILAQESDFILPEIHSSTRVKKVLLTYEGQTSQRCSWRPLEGPAAKQ